MECSFCFPTNPLPCNPIYAIAQLLQTRRPFILPGVIRKMVLPARSVLICWLILKWQKQSTGQSNYLFLQTRWFSVVLCFLKKKKTERKQTKDQVRQVGLPINIQPGGPDGLSPSTISAIYFECVLRHSKWILSS